MIIYHNFLERKLLWNVLEAAGEKKVKALLNGLLQN